MSSIYDDVETERQLKNAARSQIIEKLAGMSGAELLALLGRLIENGY
jgi:hypothetical protein